MDNKKLRPEEVNYLHKAVEGCIVEGGMSMRPACEKMGTNQQRLRRYLSQYEYNLLKQLPTARRLILKSGNVVRAAKILGLSHNGFRKRYPYLNTVSKEVRHRLSKERYVRVMEWLPRLQGLSIADICRVTKETKTIVSNAVSMYYGLGEGGKLGLKSKV